MHIRNHSRPLMVLLSLFIFCSQVFAEEYAELSACRLHFQTVVQPGATDIAAMDNWCLQSAKMNPLDVCADQKLYPFMVTNSINNDEKIRRREIFRQECSREKNSQVAGSNQILQNASTTTSSTAPAGAVIAEKAGVTYAPATVAGAPRQPILNLQQIKECAGVTNVNACEAANQSAIRANNLAGDAFRSAQPAYARDLAAFETQQKNAENKAAAQRQQGQQATLQAVTNAAGSAFGVVGDTSNNAGSASANTGSIGGATRPADVANVPTQTVTNTQSATADTSNVAAPSPAQEAALQRDISSQCASGLREQPPPFTSEIAGNCTQLPGSRNAELDETRTQLTQDGDARRNEITQTVSTADTRSQQLNQPGNSVGFTNFTGAYTPMSKTVSEDFVTKKNQCVQKAERASKFCLEGTSPGAKFAKALIDYSGPVLAAVRSAHKACSQTAKVTNIAQGALILAKGVCVAMKLSCDSGCAATDQEIKQINTNINTLREKLALDVRAAEQFCAAFEANLTTAPQAVPCRADASFKKAAATQIITSLSEQFNREIDTSTAGSTASMIAHCHDKTKDILLMGTNILTLAAAKGSAQKCEKQLAASGGGTSGDVTSADYCSVAANTSTQFCKCQGTPNAEGCGAVLAAGVPEASSSNQIGANLKTGSGVSGFAGGTGGGGSGSGSDFGIGSEGRAATGLAADLNGKSSFGAGLGGAGGAGAGGGGAGGGAGGDPNAAAAGAKDEKKPGFGSLAGLANSLGGMFGGGRGGAAAGNGALSSQQQAAIQRKLASDKIAGEVTSSSGLDNFSKIKKSYGQKAETFMTAP